MQDYKQLQVWEKGHQLTLGIYRHTSAFPNTETYALTNQMRRAAVSIQHR